MKYFLICNSDGDVSIYEYSKEQLIAEITPDESGDSNLGYVGDIKFLDHMPRDLQQLGDGEYVIIKGEVVVPEAVKVVTQFEIK